METIDQIKEEFKSGQLSKADFIKKIHKIHQYLFEYSELIKTTDIAKIEVEDEQVVMTTREAGIKILCDKYDERIIPLEILNFGEFEGDELRIIKTLISPSATIFDIGANIGWYSINLSKGVPDANVVAFEPVPSTYQQLLSNLALNDVKNVQAHNIGLSNDEGTKDMYVYKEGMGNASLRDLSGRDHVEKITARFSTMDRFVHENKIYPDFIKCDVEGAELFVFQGGTETLRQYKPVVFTEMLRKWSAKFDYHPNDIISFFADIGYLCYVINGDKISEVSSVDENTLETNYIFISRDRIEAFNSIIT